VGNIHFLLGLVAALGIEYPALWAFALLTKVTLSTVATPDPDHNVFTRGFYWL